MTQNIDQVTDEMAQELTGSKNEDVSGLIVTTASMIELLLQSRFSSAKIEEMTGSDPGFVKAAMNDDTVFDEAFAPKEIKRLRVLFLREALKSLFRKHPFIGNKKAAQRLGISAKECNFIYDGLIASGELKFKMSKPTWTGAEKTELLREHLVID